MKYLTILVKLYNRVSYMSKNVMSGGKYIVHILVLPQITWKKVNEQRLYDITSGCNL